jgi:hypothetical protein
MTSIQGILIVCFAAAAAFGSILFRTKLVHRLLALLLGAGAIVFIIFPDLTTVVAKSLGVGRGADLLLYVSLIAGVHITLVLYRRTRDLERKLAEHIRAAALRDTQFIGDK